MEKMIEEIKEYKKELFNEINHNWELLSKDAQNLYKIINLGSVNAIDKCIEIAEKYKKQEEDTLKFYYCESENKYYVGRRADNFYYADVMTYPNCEVCLSYGMSRYLPWGEGNYPTEPKEVSFEEWLCAFLKKYKAQEPR